MPSGRIVRKVCEIAPAFNLFFTTGLMVSLAGASVPLVFLISMVGMVATTSSLAQFATVYPSASPTSPARSAPGSRSRLA